MFESLSDRLTSTLQALRGKGRLTDADIDATTREIRLALLEADVSLPVVRAFVTRVKERAQGAEVSGALNPAQQVVKIVNEELVGILGGATRPLAFAKTPPTVIMLAGLQGAGKTTLAGKLAVWLRGQGHTPLLVACDLQRPGAVNQLQIVGERAAVTVFAPHPGTSAEAVEAGAGPGDPVAVAAAGLAEARAKHFDVVVVDTAGRLGIDEEMMAQAAAIRAAVNPDEVLFVLDAMVGQDAVATAEAFRAGVGFTGVVLTKLDGDARGGAALSVKQVTGVPVKFVGTGEHLDALEEFHPDRMAGRILGQGDLLSLVEKAQQEFDQDEMQRQEERLKKGEFTLDDFRKQLSQMTKLGPLQKVMGMIPGMSNLGDALDDVDPEQDLKRLFGIIDSMTAAERQNPTKQIDQARRRRIAAGAGVEPHEVNDLVKQFDAMAQMMTSMAGKGIRERMKMVKQLQSGMMAGGNGLSKQKKGTGKRLSPQERAKLKKDREKELRKRKREQRRGST